MANDLYDQDDGYLNRLELTAGLVEIRYGKKAITLAIQEIDDTGWGQEERLVLRLPTGKVPEDIDLAPDQYILALERLRRD